MKNSWRFVTGLAIVGILAASAAAQTRSRGARQGGDSAAMDKVVALPTFADIVKTTPAAKDGVTVAAYEAAVIAALPADPAPDAAAKFAAKARADMTWGGIVGAVTPRPTAALDPATVKLTEAQYTAAVAALSSVPGAAGPWKTGDRLRGAEAPDIAGKPLEVSAQFDVTGPEGVIVTQGGTLNGYAIYLGNGKLTFAVRRDGELTTIVAKDSLSNGHHALVATLRRGGGMALVVDGKEVARGEAAGLIGQQPAAGFAVGSAPFMAVGEFETPNPFQGNVTDVRVKTTDPSSDASPLRTGSDPGQNGITGTWKAEEVDFAPWTFTLKADGSKLSGTVSQGKSNGSTSTGLTGDTPIYDGAIEGKKVSFKCDVPGGGRTITFSGVMEGVTVSFTREVKVDPGASPGMSGIYGASGASKFMAKWVSDSNKATPERNNDQSPRKPLANGALSTGSPVADLPVLSIKDVTRVDRGTRPSQQDAVTSTYILKTSPHATLGDGYVIVTDQTEPAFLEPLDRLAKFHHGSIINVKDLNSLRSDAAERDQLASDLRRAKPRYVAVAPKQLTENMLLGLWCVLAMLGDDQQLPVCPGFFAAPNAAAFKSLVDRSIDYHPQAEADVRPFVIGQVVGSTPNGQRSLQKVRMMRKMFAEYGCTTNSLVALAYTAVSRGVTVAPASNQWQVAMSGMGDFVKAVPAEARPALDAASLVLMFGHGSRGNTCSLDDRAFRDVNMNGKVVMCGDCFSAAGPATSSRPAFDEGSDATLAPGEGESFAMRAVGNGAVVVYAHMAENAGFPHLFPVLDGWMDGLPVGEAYQRLVNALLAFEHLTAADLSSRNARNLNSLLYVVIGDPALQPLAKMTPHNAASPVSPPTLQKSDKRPQKAMGSGKGANRRARISMALGNSGLAL